MADQKQEQAQAQAQAQAIVEFLTRVYAGNYSLDEERPDTVHRNQRAADFAFSDVLGNRVGSIEITIRGEHVVQKTEHEDGFGFEKHFPLFKQTLEDRFNNEIQGRYTLDVPWRYRLPKKGQELEEFIKLLKGLIDAWPDGCHFQILMWRRNEFFLALDSRSGSGLFVQWRPRWTRAPKSQDLVPALDHIVEKFQDENDHQLTIGAVDVSDWAVASGVDRAELADALQARYRRLSHLFLIMPSYRLLLGVAPESSNDNDWQKCGRFDVLKVW